MSAVEIIEQIKKLSPEERRAVRSFINSEPAEREAVVTEEFKKIADRVFGENNELFRKLAQ